MPVPVPEPEETRNGLMNRFDHEKLDVYQVAIDLVTLASQIVRELPRGNAHLADQLQRAAISIPLNIAEGAGEYSRKDKARFYRIAKRSATECAATLDVCLHLRLINLTRHKADRKLLLRIVAMLTKLASTGSSSGTGTGAGTGTSLRP